MRIAEAIGGAIMLLLALFALQQSIALQLWSYGGPGPGLFPFVLGALLAPMAAAYLGLALYRWVRERRGIFVARPTVDGEDEGPVLVWRVAGYVLCLVIFVGGMVLVGWKLGLVAAMLTLTGVVERVGWRKSLIYTVCFLVGSYLLFERGLAVPLPNGMLW